MTACRYRAVVRAVMAGLLMALATSSFGRSRHLTLMGLGDSITEGGVSGGQAFSTYLFPLWQRLFTNGYDVDFIGPRSSECRIGKLSHCGFSGHTAEFLNSIIDSVYRQYPADIVLLHAGHNHKASENPVDGIVGAYKEIINKIRAINPRAYIFVAAVTPSGKLPKYSYIPELDSRIDSLVSTFHNRRVRFVDMSQGHDWRAMTIADRVHPNKAGREFMAGKWMAAIAKAIRPQNRAFHPDILKYKPDGRGDSLTLHVFHGRGTGKLPAVVYFFAGGWKHGTPLQFYRECRHLSRKGFTAISADYRIGSLYGTTAADATADGEAAIDYVRRNAAALHVDTARLAVAGASAGATIAGKIDDSKVSARLLCYPVVDSLKHDVGRMRKPVMLLMGTRDQFSPMPKVEAFVEAMKRQGVPVELRVFNGLGHPLFRYREPLTSVYTEILRLTDDFLEKQLKK